MNPTFEILIVAGIVTGAVGYIASQVWQLIHGAGCSCKSGGCGSEKNTPEVTQTTLTVAGKAIH